MPSKSYPNSISGAQKRYRKFEVLSRSQKLTYPRRKSPSITGVLSKGSLGKSDQLFDEPTGQYKGGMVKRCVEEAREEQNNVAHRSEPLRLILHGVPG